MKLTFLGTGTSTGVPEIGCQCETCISNDPRDKRLRCSAIVEVEGKNILIDCGPDFRTQMLENKIKSIDAVLITHEHYDHVGGLDDIRPFSFDKDMPIYAEQNVIDAIQTRMPYAFQDNHLAGLPHFNLQPVDITSFKIADIEVTPIRLMHGKLPIVGYRIGSMAYLTDVKTIPEEEFGKLTNLDVLVIEALRLDNKHKTHAGLDEALALIERINPRHTYLTHISHRLGKHNERESLLPANTFLAYDNLQINLTNT
jgi:Metal-dependent hydrolases of the beta-lactamase superfamily I